MNIIDKAVGFFNPEAGLKRALARSRTEYVVNSGYSRHGASYARKSLQGWLTSGNDADADIVDNVETLRNRSRDLYMGTPLATGALKTIRTNVVGSGLSLDAQIDADVLGLSEDEAREWERNTEREWRLWADSVNCDAERRQTFYQMQSLVLLSALMNGDVFVTMPIIPRKGVPYDLRIGIIEADRVCNPLNAPEAANILGGIEVGKYGETVAVWVTKHHPGAYTRLGQDMTQEWKRVLAFGATTGRRNILQIMCDVERPAQRRGVPILAPVVEAMKQIGRYTEAELAAAVVAGMFTVFVKTESPPQGGLGQMFRPEDRVSDDDSDYELGNGAIVNLNTNESIETASPGRPNAQYENFVSAVSRQIGTALELPYELMLKSFTASYSASRGALLEAWKMFRMRREWLVDNFCQPVYEEWLTEAILKGRVKAPGFFDDPVIRAAWCGTVWYGDSHGQLDPIKEANAAKIRVEEGFSTRARETAELTGMKFDVVHGIRKREEEMRRADGLVPSATAPQPPAPVKPEEEENGDNDTNEGKPEEGLE